MEPGANMNVQRTPVQKEYPSIGTILDIPFAVATIPDPANWECETAEEVIELCQAITSITEEHDCVTYEWNYQDGWDYITDDPDAIDDWCTVWQGEPADSNEETKQIFHEAVLREYQTRSRIYSSYSVDELVEYWIPKYNVGDKHFILGSITVPVEPRVKTVVEESE